MRTIFQDPITLILGIMLSVVWVRINDWAMDQLLPEAPDEFSFAGAMFFMLVAMVAILAVVRLGIHVVLKL